ncbi:MAG TPA: hypothetical protein VN203_17320, partial [Candidatus Acidoferrum sp.]|nr:hypothetical protein [Candidatus Acidoferrum sp.]
ASCHQRCKARASIHEYFEQGANMATQARQPKVADEIARIPYEPFEPVERKLIAWSLGLGVVLLVVLIWISYTFFGG